MASCLLVTVHVLTAAACDVASMMATSSLARLSESESSTKSSCRVATPSIGTWDGGADSAGGDGLLLVRLMCKGTTPCTGAQQRDRECDDSCCTTISVLLPPVASSLSSSFRHP